MPDIFHLYWRYPVRVSALLLVALVALVALKFNLLRNIMSDATPVNADYLHSITEVNDSLAISYVTFQGDGIYRSGFESVIKTNGRVTSTQNVLVLELGDKLVLVERPTEWSATDLRVTGFISPILNKTQSEVIEPLVQRSPELRDRILPFTVIETRYHDQQRLVFGAVLGSMVIAILIGPVIGFWRASRH